MGVLSGNKKKKPQRLAVSAPLANVPSQSPCEIEIHLDFVFLQAFCFILLIVLA